MRYLGGKSRIAAEIAAIVNAERGARAFWDPFCGGLGAARALAYASPGLVSDAFPPLIALYQAVRAGWDPPAALSRAEYAAARELPDSDPRKAFAGFGCSFGAKWFAGYAPPNTHTAHKATGDETVHANPARATRKALIRDLAALRGCAIERLDFLAIEPRPLPIVIYADLPYAGTEPYAGLAPFDSGAFWALIQGWERAGVPCFVSEYACPVPHSVVWEKAHPLRVAGGVQKAARLERLFRVTV